MSDNRDTDKREGAPHPRDTLHLVGHAGAEAALLAAYRSGRLHHAWLFAGPEGVGKATLAWRFARFLLAYPDPALPAVQDAGSLALPATHPVSARLAAGAVGDVAVLRRGWNDKARRPYTEIRVDDVRANLSVFQHAAGAGGFRVCIIDSADDLNRSSANALLKLIEEPPPRSVFLILAHRPSLVLPTVLSRCRKLFLAPLSAEEVSAALAALPPGETPLGDVERQAIAVRSGGSVGGAVQLLDTERRGLDRDIHAQLDRLPAVDARSLHRIADRLGPSDSATLAAIGDAILAWVHGRLKAGAGTGQGARNLAPLAEVWEKIAASLREADALNLDRRPLILSIFADLAAAYRAAGGT